MLPVSTGMWVVSYALSGMLAWVQIRSEILLNCLCGQRPVLLFFNEMYQCSGEHLCVDPLPRLCVCVCEEEKLVVSRV